MGHFKKLTEIEKHLFTELLDMVNEPGNINSISIKLCRQEIRNIHNFFKDMDDILVELEHQIECDHEGIKRS